jgi:hypothetical protein
MKMSDTINQLSTALAIAQGQIDDAVKDRKNDFYKAKYADLSSVRAAIRKPFADNGLSVVQFPRTVQGGIEVETMLMHSSGEFMAETLFLPVKSEIHPIGSGISYARRYALMSIANLAADDDDGVAAQVGHPAKEPTPEERALALKASKVAEKGTAALSEFWKGLTQDQRKVFDAEAIADLKALAAQSEPKKETK